MEPILYCHCAYFDVEGSETRRTVLAALQAAEVELTAVKDLCALAADGDPLLSRLARKDGLAVVACHGRAVRALFASAGSRLEEGRVTLLNTRTQSAAEILDALGLREVAGSADESALQPVGSWKPWFPVIDADRCVQCKQCLNFCLFGVYEADADGNVRVANPDQCKTHCPACARVCPSAAILFPKYKSGPICGEDLPAGGSPDEPVGVDVAELVAGDVHQALRNRGAPAGESPSAEVVRQVRRRLSDAAEDGSCQCKGGCSRCPETP